jgi:hypothetical protein
VALYLFKHRDNFTFTSFVSLLSVTSRYIRFWSGWRDLKGQLESVPSQGTEVQVPNLIQDVSEVFICLHAALYNTSSTYLVLFRGVF